MVVALRRAIMDICLARTFVFFMKFVCRIAILVSVLDISPIAVPVPVAVTITLAYPPTTNVPHQTIFFRSARRVSVVNESKFLLTGSDSPVSEASIVLKFFDWMILASAATLSPSSSTNTSPGTTWEESTVFSFPSLNTLAVFTIIFWRAVIAFSARYSWKKPKIVSVNITKTIIQLSTTCPTAYEIIAAGTRMRTIRFLNCLMNNLSNEIFSGSGSAFGP